MDRARGHVRDRIRATYHPEAESLGRALVLGETDLDRDADEAFRVTGLSHLLAVSGTHLVIAVLGLCAALRALLLRIEVVAARTDVSRVAAGIAIPLSWAYADFAGGGGSVLRAAAMVTAASLARALGRSPSPARCFAASLFAGVFVDPLALLDLSFALSSAATLGLMTLSRPIASLIGAGPADPLRLEDVSTTDPSFYKRVWMHVGGAMATTLGATIACAPLIISTSPTLPAAGVLANLVAAPLGEAFALPFALLHAVLSLVPPLERGAAFVAAGSLRGVLLVARAARATGFVLPLPPPSGATLAVLAISVTLALAATRRAVRLFGVFAGVALLGALELRARDAGRPTGHVRISVLDVGQGDSIAVDLPDGSFMLVDGGGVPGSDFDVGERVVMPVLRARRRTRIDVAVISHPHPDHYAGLVTTLARLDVGEIWDTGESERDGVARGDLAKIFDDARRRGIPIRRPKDLCGQPHEIGGATIEVLAPCPEADPALSTNDASFVLRIRHGHRAALLAGDLELEGEMRLLETRAESLRADFLKIGHHGSKTSTSAEFLAAVSPRYAAISCGVRNRFGHPAKSVLEALEGRGIPVGRTDRNGEQRWTTD
ncbi:MAG: MBL fold metallo-hydrolase [Polyangiaceae bacterium]|nr:MBL fold metallo-hydrolase [Polyangiaceae bacterium]